MKPRLIFFNISGFNFIHFIVQISIHFYLIHLIFNIFQNCCFFIIFWHSWFLICFSATNFLAAWLYMGRYRSTYADQPSTAQSTKHAKDIITSYLLKTSNSYIGPGFSHLLKIQPGKNNQFLLIFIILFILFGFFRVNFLSCFFRKWKLLFRR